MALPLLPFTWTDIATGFRRIAETINAILKGEARDVIGINLHPITAAEIAASITPTDYAYQPYDVRRYGVDPADADVTAALADIADKLEYLWFPLGTYRITTTIQRLPNSRWVGEAPQSNENGSGDSTPEVVIYGTVANIGNGNPLVRLCESNVAASSFVTENIEFRSDLSVTVTNLGGISSTGVVGVLVDHAKNGVRFKDCGFRNLKQAILQSDTDPYTDAITYFGCHFTRLYQAINANPTAGQQFYGCLFFDNRDVLLSTTDAQFFGCELNNTAASGGGTNPDPCGIKAANITWIGGWIEGGNKVFQPTRSLTIIQPKVSEMQSSGDKFLIYPQNTEITMFLSNFRVPTNTRLLDLGLINSADYDTIHIRGEGLQDGTNFANNAAITGYLDDGLDWRGWGNQNAPSPTWNVDNANPKGTWTPTLTGVANSDGTTAVLCHYTYDRRQAVVRCWGKLNVNPTAGTTLTQIGISLPVASNFAAEQDCSGTAAATTVAESGAITADSTNDRAQLNFISAGTTDHTIMFQFSYRVLS